MSTDIGSLEKRVIDAVHSSMHEVIAAKFTGYSSPLDTLLKAVVEKHSAEISALFDSAVSSAIVTVDLRFALKDSFDKKLSKVLLAGFEGEIERRANKLREDPAFRAKITVAIDAAVKSCTP